VPGIAGVLENIMEFIVEGMTCSHCVRAISEAVQRLGGTARVDLDRRTVTVDGALDREAVARAIEEEGYQVVGERD